MPHPGRILAGLLLATMLAQAPGFAAVNIIVPRDKLLTRTDTLIITGRARRGQQLQWSVQRSGTTETDTVTADWGNLFEIFLLLEPGLNRVRVEEAGVDIFYDSGGMEVPEGYRPQRVHGGDIARCDDCHEPQQMHLRNGGYPRVCFTCHIVVSSNPDNLLPADQDDHFRTAAADCGRCHAPHTAADPMLLKDSRAALCGTCHPERAASPSRHRAAEIDDCSACHDPHYSGYPAVLHEPQPELCLRCHDQGPAEGERHPPVRRREACTVCHDPHGNGPALLRAEGTGLCAGCHGAVLERGHGEELSGCADCHDSHGVLGSGMLRENVSERCSECHDEVGEGLVRHAALDEGCQECHRPHTDDDLRQARRSCSECHDLRNDQQLLSLHGNLQLDPGTCLRCHPPHASDLTRLVRGNLHYPLAQGKCSACHGGGADRSVVVNDAAARCRMCHPFERELAIEGATLHEPVAAGRCGDCHDPHMSVQRAFLHTAEAPLCRSCHEIAQPEDGKELHPPAESCSECHSPHGGANPFFLASAPDESCLECHDDPRTGPTTTQHPALEEGCSSCHDPHAGFVPGYLRGDSPMAACGECHDVPDLTDGRRPHSAATDCSACHAPHGGEQPAYLVVDPNNPCAACHEVPGEEGKVHAALGEGCGTCHDTHSGYGEAVLHTPERELCLECHDDPVAGASHPHTPAVQRCSACHRPHGARQPALLRAPWKELCVRCHDFGAASLTRVVHEPAADCDNCHSMGPHGASRRLGLEPAPPELCLQCHDDPREAPGNVHPAMDEGCLVCHAAHAGHRPGLQAGTTPGSVCLDCHEDPTADRPVVHAVLAQGCTPCHEPHASTRASLLRATGNALCRTCHDTDRHRHTLDSRLGAKYPEAKPFPLSGKEYACIGCHRPHAADQVNLYPAPSNELCEHCHEL